MASIFDRIENRERFPVEGTDLRVREPLIDEIMRSLAVPVELQRPLLMAFCIVDANGETVMKPADGETDEAFAKRATAEVKGMRGRVYNATWNAIQELLKPVDPADLAKKS